VETAPSLIFITGGVRSGKSSFAEMLALKIACEEGGQLHYIATGVPSDLEMKQRIKKHQHDREAAKYRWITVEQSTDIGSIADHFHNQDILLLDCVTTLLNNELFSSNHTWDPSLMGSIGQKIITGIMKIKNRVKTMIVVSNEVLYEPIPDNDLVFTYGCLLGQIHQQLVKEAEQAFLVEAGVPLVMKGANDSRDGTKI
jgi:adenosylcobinamide kinase/adenosylcobinamide-phosphate guanylyltransferase